jgi:hypothetical protein
VAIPFHPIGYCRMVDVDVSARSLSRETLLEGYPLELPMIMIGDWRPPNRSYDHAVDERERDKHRRRSDSSMHAACSH